MTETNPPPPLDLRAPLSHDAAIKALCDCAATVTVLSYQEAIEGYLELRGISVDADNKAGGLWYRRWRTLLTESANDKREIERLRAGMSAACNALESLDAGTSRTYKARNGRDVGIQADDGEACDIIHSDITYECLCALEAVRALLEGAAK
jgi:hypothetical protein